MKIQELEITKIVKRNKNPTEILQQAGWKVLGTGLDGAVAQHPKKSYVLKLFVSNSAYVPFVHYVQTHQSNPHLPKFDRYVRKVPGTNLSYVRMEKLKHIPNEGFDLAKTHPGEILSLYSIAEAHKLVDELDYYWLIDELGLRALPKSQNLDQFYYEEGIEPPESSWVQAITDLINISQSQHVGWDLDLKNMMLRGTDLVITDPFYLHR